MGTILESLKRYFQDNTDKKIISDWSELKKYDEVGPLVVDFIIQTYMLFYEKSNTDKHWEFFYSNQLVTNPEFSSDFF